MTTVELHPRLRDPKYRFIKVGHRSKTPLEKGWNEPEGNARYPFDNPQLLEYLAAGGNYGVLPGFGNLIIFDVDEVERLRELGVVQFFEGKTFTVTKRDTGKLHFYFECEGLERKIVFLDPEKMIPSKIGRGNPQPLHLGECYCSGAFQVVGPNSIHPSGATYEVALDVPFMKITKDEFMQIFSRLVMKRQDFKDTGIIPRSTSMSKQGGTLSDVLGLKVDTILLPDNIMRVNNGVYQGSHPIHGSTYGSNFIVDTKKNVWHCFAEGTYVDTPEGLFPIESLKTNDLVYGSDGNPHKITETFFRPYSGTMNEIITPYTPIRVTPEHPILIAHCNPCKRKEIYKVCRPNCPRRDKKHACKGNGDPVIIWKQAKDIEPLLDFIIIRKNKPIDKRINLIKYSVEPVKMRVNQEIDCDLDFSEFIGWYLAEGHLSNDSRGYFHRIQFTLGYDEMEHATRIKELSHNIFNRLNPNINRYIHRGTTLVTGGSTIVARMIKNLFGNGSKNKMMGPLLHSNELCVKVLLKALFNGDGSIHVTTHNRAFKTVSRHLASDIFVALLSIGIFSNIYLTVNRRNYFVNDKKVNVSPIYTIQFPKERKVKYFWGDDSYWYLPIMSNDKINYSGNVYNLETEDHTYQVPFIVHNCFRDHTGGGPLELYAMKKGIIDCHQVRRGCLTGKWPRIFRELEQDGYKIPLLDFRETLRKNPDYLKRKEQKDAKRKIYSKY